MTNRSAFTHVLTAVAVIAVVSHVPAQELGNKHVGPQPDGSVQQFTTVTDPNGSSDGLVYSQDGLHLYFSQDDGGVTIADVAADGTLTVKTQINLPTHTGTTGIPNDPILPVQSSGANNGGLALAADQKTLYVV